MRRLALHPRLLDEPPLLQGDDVPDDLRLRYARGVVQLVHCPRAPLHLHEERVPLQLHRRSLLHDEAVPRVRDRLAEDVACGRQLPLLAQEPPDPLALDGPSCRLDPGLPVHPHPPPLIGVGPSSLIVSVNSVMVFWNFSPSPAEIHSSLSLSGSYPNCCMS